MPLIYLVGKANVKELSIVAELHGWTPTLPLPVVSAPNDLAAQHTIDTIQYIHTYHYHRLS